MLERLISRWTRPLALARRPLLEAPQVLVYPEAIYLVFDHPLIQSNLLQKDS